MKERKSKENQGWPVDERGSSARSGRPLFWNWATPNRGVFISLHQMCELISSWVGIGASRIRYRWSKYPPVTNYLMDKISLPAQVSAGNILHSYSHPSSMMFASTHTRELDCYYNRWNSLYFKHLWVKRRFRTRIKSRTCTET